MIAKLKTPLFLLACVPMLHAQGSLTPPGAPAPSMKTLGQIEPRVAIESLPFKIAQPGSYYVATNLAVPNGTNGISILANAVTLDLGGFALRAAGDAGAAILVGAGQRDVTIRNGSIIATGGGIEASGAARVRVERVKVDSTLGHGIALGADSVAERCEVSAAEGSGIKAGPRSTVLNCEARENLVHGIELENFGVARDCQSARNGGSGVAAKSNTRISNVSAHENNGAGIYGDSNVTISDSTASQNKQAGIRVENYALITRANASFNHAAGVQAGRSCSVLDSQASGNALGGIAADAGAQVANCMAEGNAGAGIAAGEGSTIRDCTSSRNGNDGIYVTSECTVVRNQCNNNINIKSASGVHAAGTDNIIQENTLVSNDRGLALDQGGNLVTKNSATNNSLNYYVIGEQTMGAIVTRIDEQQGEPITPVSNFAY